MPLWDFACAKHQFEKLCHTYIEKMRCQIPGCKRMAHVVFVATSGVGARDFSGSDPVVIHRAADGAIRFPGNVNAKVPEGFERVELKTTAEKRKFEKEINRNEYQKWHDSQERKEAYFGAMRHESRRELFAQMHKLPPLARDLAMAAIKARNAKIAPRYDAGFHIEALSMDASNRNSCYDERGRGRK